MHDGLSLHVSAWMTMKDGGGAGGGAAGEVKGVLAPSLRDEDNKNEK